MPIKFEDEDEGNILTVRASGKLTKADFIYFSPEFERLVRLNGKLRVMFNMVDFEGWEASALWEEIKFDMKHFNDIERLAMIGDKKWEETIAGFCKPFTGAQVRYFDHTDGAQARQWLEAP